MNDDRIYVGAIRAQDILVKARARVHQIENITYIHERCFENYDIVPTTRFVIIIIKKKRTIDSTRFFFSIIRAGSRETSCVPQPGPARYNNATVDD